MIRPFSAQARLVMGFFLVALVVLAPTANAQVTDEQVVAGIKAYVDKLYALQNKDGHWDPAAPKDGDHHYGTNYGGTTALAVYALLKSGESYQDPRLQKAVKFLMDTQLNGTYAVGVRAHVWGQLPDWFAKKLSDDVKWLTDAAHQVGTGGLSWRYTKYSTDWDNSAAQYGLLGLWEGAKRNIPVGQKLWTGVEGHFVNCQTEDGGWYYAPGGAEGAPTGTMTAAGVTCLYILQDFLHSQDYKTPGKARDHPIQARIDKGMGWLNKNYKGGEGNFYYLVCIERVGLASGVRYFNGQDWYQSGAKDVISGMPGDPANLGFGLIFLVAGRYPLFVNKLQITDYDWNNRPRDAANLTRWVSDEVEKEMNWQYVSADSNPEEWLTAPLLYLTSHEPLKLTEKQEANVKRYIDLGGMLVTTADGGSAQFTRSVHEMLEKFYPHAKFKPIDKDDELNSVVFKLNGNRLNANSLHNGVRHLALHIPKDISWTFHSINQTDPLPWQFFVNAYYYATEKGQARPRLSKHFIARAAKGATSTSQVALARYEGNWAPEPMAWEVQANFMYNANKTATTVKVVDLASLDTADTPLVHITGTEKVDFTEVQVEAMKKYVASGGVVFIENAGGTNRFMPSVMDMLAKAYPGQRPRPLSLQSPLITGKDIDGYDVTKVDYRAYALLKLGRTTTPRLLAISFNDKPQIIISGEDLTEAMINQPVWGVFGYSSASAQKIMTNLVLWSNKNSPKVAAAVP